MSEPKSEKIRRVGELYSVAETLEGYRAALLVGGECRCEAHGLAIALSGLTQKVNAIAAEIDTGE